MAQLHRQCWFRVEVAEHHHRMEAELLLLLPPLRSTTQR